MSIEESLELLSYVSELTKNITFVSEETFLLNQHLDIIKEID